MTNVRNDKRQNINMLIVYIILWFSDVFLTFFPTFFRRLSFWRLSLLTFVVSDVCRFWRLSFLTFVASDVCPFWRLSFWRLSFLTFVVLTFVGVPIKRVLSTNTLPAMKFLGIYFDPDLSFKFHISTLKNKLSKALYALRTVRNTLNQQSLFLIYNSIFHCHLLYAIQIWSCARSSLIN